MAPMNWIQWNVKRLATSNQYLLWDDDAIKKSVLMVVKDKFDVLLWHSPWSEMRFHPDDATIPPNDNDETISEHSQDS